MDNRCFIDARSFSVASNSVHLMPRSRGLEHTTPIPDNIDPGCGLLHTRQLLLRPLLALAR